MSKIEELEARIKRLENTKICDACKGRGKKAWLAVGATSLSQMPCFKCKGTGKIPLRR